MMTGRVEEGIGSADLVADIGCSQKVVTVSHRVQAVDHIPE